LAALGGSRIAANKSNASDGNEAKRLLKLARYKYRPKVPKLTDWMERSMLEGLLPSLIDDGC